MKIKMLIIPILSTVSLSAFAGSMFDRDTLLYIKNTGWYPIVYSINCTISDYSEDPIASESKSSPLVQLGGSFEVLIPKGSTNCRLSASSGGYDVFDLDLDPPSIPKKVDTVSIPGFSRPLPNLIIFQTWGPSFAKEWGWQSPYESSEYLEGQRFKYKPNSYYPAALQNVLRACATIEQVGVSFADLMSGYIRYKLTNNCNDDVRFEVYTELDDEGIITKDKIDEILPPNTSNTFGGYEAKGYVATIAPRIYIKLEDTKNSTKLASSLPAIDQKYSFGPLRLKDVTKVTIPSGWKARFYLEEEFRGTYYTRDDKSTDFTFLKDKTIKSIKTVSGKL